MHEVKNMSGILKMVVYSSGFEPELDGVGGRNVIQLHHEYLILKAGLLI